MAHQEIEVHAVFNLNGESYTTEKAKVTIGETSDDDEVITLKLSKDVIKRLKDAETARKAKEEEAKKAEEKKNLCNLLPSRLPHRCLLICLK